MRYPTSLLVVASCMAASPADTGPAAQTPAAAGAARLETTLLLQTLNADLLSHDSATGTLERWCTTYRLASPPRMTAERVPGVDKAPTAEQLRQLAVTARDAVRYRRVKLLCGSLVLSEADNWYVPARLTPQMNYLLDSTDTPFGVAVRSLHFQRHTISARVLASLLPAGWETMSPDRIGEAGEACLPEQLLEHRALLTLPDGTPFSEVVETYTSNVLAIPGRSVARCSH